MNKLTPEKEDILKLKFTNELNPDSYVRLEKMVALLFSTAIENDRFSELYARLCRFIHDTWHREDKHSFWFNKDTNKFEPIQRTTSRDTQVKLKSFREVLLSRAQHEFMKLKIIPIKDKSQFEKGSVEWKLLDSEEKLKLLPPKDAPEVRTQGQGQIIV